MSSRRPDASMTLLTELMDRPLDPSYATAADARRRRGEPLRRRPWSTPIVAGASILVGLLFATSALTFARPDPVRAEERRDLVARINEHQDEIDAQGARIVALRDDVTRLGEGTPASPPADTEALAIGAGAVAVAGPGLRIVLDDAASLGPVGGGGPREGGGDDLGRIISADVQNVTNALWASGAEAIAVNGHRLTSTSAIRFAGRAILVGFRPLARPYVIEAVMGEPERRRFLDGPGGNYLTDLRTGFSARAEARAVSALEIPAADALTLRHARIPDDLPAREENE